MEVKTGYKKTDVGIIPDDWVIASIGSRTSISVGRDLRKQNFSLNRDNRFRYPVFSNTVSNEGLYGYYDIPEYEGDSLTVVGRGVGLGTAFKRNGGFGAIGRLLVLFPHKDTDAKYLTDYVNNRVKVYSESGGIPQLTGISFAKYRIPLPPTKAEQVAIANALSGADALISSLEKLIVKKRNIKQAAVQMLLQPKEGWKSERLGNVTLSISSGKSNTKSEEGQYPIYGSTGIIAWATKFDYEGEKLLVARVGANAGTVNKVSKKYCVSDNTLVVSLDKTVDINFAYYSLINFKLNTLVFGSGQPLITGGQLKALSFPMPVKDEQVYIAAILSDMDADIAVLEAKLEKYKQIKQGMMQNLLTGKVRLI